jgi:hypothetical protein
MAWGVQGARSALKIDSRGEEEEQPEALRRRCLRSSIKLSVNYGIGQRKSIRGCVRGWGVGKTKQGLRLLDLPTVSSRSWPQAWGTPSRNCGIVRRQFCQREEGREGGEGGE